MNTLPLITCQAGGGGWGSAHVRLVIRASLAGLLSSVKGNLCELHILVDKTRYSGAQVGN